jgi:cell division protein FtsA
MREQVFPHFVGLDVGTSTVRCVVGMIDNPDNPVPSVIGYGLARNNGMRKGAVVHIDDVAQAIVEAITEAERVSGIHIQEATVNVNGSHVAGINSRGVIAISTANREISIEDRMRVEEAATIIQLPPNRDIIQVFAKNYRLDGQENIKDPVGMQGVRLEVDTHIVTAATPSLKSLDMALGKAGVHPSHHTVSGLAAVEAVLNRQQKESGTVLLDIGAGTTNIVIVEDGEIQHVAVLPVGGTNLTNDLAIGLKTDLDIAESIKVEHGTLHKPDKRSGANIHFRDAYYSREDIQMILEARVEELLELVDKELKKVGKSRKLPGGVVLTGGTAKLPGLAEYTRDQLELPARIGKLQPVGGLMDSVNDVAYTTAVGMMLLDMLLVQHPGSQGSGVEGGGGLIRALTGFGKRFGKRS